jgi:hypothetical protein
MEKHVARSVQRSFNELMELIKTIISLMEGPFDGDSQHVILTVRVTIYQDCHLQNFQTSEKRR